jgi:hypothetical protein
VDHTPTGFRHPDRGVVGDDLADLGLVPDGLQDRLQNLLVGLVQVGTKHEVLGQEHQVDAAGAVGLGGSLGFRFGQPAGFVLGGLLAGRFGFILHVSRSAASARQGRVDVSGGHLSAGRDFTLGAHLVELVGLRDEGCLVGRIGLGFRSGPVGLSGFLEGLSLQGLLIGIHRFLLLEFPV